MTIRELRERAGLGAGMQQVQGLYYKGFLLPASLSEENHLGRHQESEKEM